MLVNVNQVLKTIEGEAMKDMVDGQAVDATVKMALINAILSPVQKENGVDKVKKYELAKKIHNSTGLVDLSAEEIALLKKLIGEIYPPITVGQSYGILDPHSEKK